jgi:hypothetical protein
MLLGVVADSKDAAKLMTDGEAKSLAALVGASITNNLVQQTWMQGPADLVKAVSDPQRYGEKWADRLVAGMLVPSVVAQAARLEDPYLKDARTMLDAIKARLAKITPGKWCQGVYWFQGVYPDGDEEYLPDANILCEGEEVARAGSTDDAAFIANAPTDIAALLAEVERLRAVLERSGAALTEIADDIRRELWLDEQDFRGHRYYDRIVDALPTLDGGEVSGG